MKWIRRLVLLALMGAVVLPGCGPSLSEKELGTIVYEVPKVPGSDQPYKLPSVTAPAPEDLAPSPGGPATDTPH